MINPRAVDSTCRGLLHVLLVAAACVCPARAEAPAAAPAGTPSPYDAALRRRGIQPDANGLIGYLRTIRPPDPRHVAELIKKLGHSRWKVREDATEKLRRMPIPPVEALEKAARSPDAEVRIRAGAILREVRQRSQTGLHAETLRLVLLAIECKRLPGAVPELLRSVAPATGLLPYAQVAATLEAVSRREDADVLRTALKSESARVRAVATAALGAALGEDAADELLALRKDDDEYVRLAAATALGTIQDHRCLQVLGQLLGDDRVDVRAAAANTLYRLTGKPFAFEAWQPVAKSARQATAWREWLARDANEIRLRPLGPTRRRNIALGKHVTSAVPESGPYCIARGQQADGLTDGAYRGPGGIAYPGGFRLDYTIDLCKTTEGTALNDLKDNGFRIGQIVIHWGSYAGPKNKEGRVNHYVQQYAVSYRTAATPPGTWHRLHACKKAPVDEATVLTGTPVVLDYTTHKRITLIAGIDLRKVTALRLEAKSRANWIGVVELEALGRPEGD